MPPSLYQLLQTYPTLSNLAALNAIEIAQELVACPSVTDESNRAITERMQGRLLALGFDVRLLEYVDLHGTAKVAIEARRQPIQGASEAEASKRGIGYFCHNDVVSVAGWNCVHGGPFSAVVADGRLWGRGACDMKGSAAAALAAISGLDRAAQVRPIYFFVTGDEECGMAGADVLVTQSDFYAEMIATQAVGIIGEPTELQLVNSHKGGCHIDISCEGVAAHSSTAEGKNANWRMIPFLAYLHEVAQRCETDSRLQNAAFSPATLSLNIVLENQPQSANITVGKSICRIFFRPMPGTDWEELLEEIKGVALGMQLDVHAIRPLLPLLTSADREFVQRSLSVLGQPSATAVCYATDGCRFHGLQDLIVLGPGSIEQAHRPDEWVSIEQLELGTRVYLQLFGHFAFRETSV